MQLLPRRGVRGGELLGIVTASRDLAALYNTRFRLEMSCLRFKDSMLEKEPENVKKKKRGGGRKKERKKHEETQLQQCRRSSIKRG